MRAEPRPQPATHRTDAAAPLRRQLLLERARHTRTVRRLMAVNRRLVAAYLSGPGYVSPNAAAWACIHRHEGAWNDGGAPYWGGLQMDLAFMRAYGSEFLARWGTADRWPVWAQLIAADRAHAVRGFTPWPATARACGVL